MRFARRIRDCRRDVIFRFRLVRLFFVCHDFLLLVRKLVSIVIRKYYTPFALKSKLLLRRFVSGIRQNRLPALFKPFPNSKRTGFGAFGVPRTSVCQKSGTKEGGAEKSTIFLNAVSRYYCRKEKERLMTANGQGELRESRLSCARKIRKKLCAFCGQTFAEEKEAKKTPLRSPVFPPFRRVIFGGTRTYNRSMNVVFAVIFILSGAVLLLGRSRGISARAARRGRRKAATLCLSACSHSYARGWD